MLFEKEKDSTTTFVDELRDVSSVALVQEVERLASLEKRQGARLIAHLSEISRRKLHLELGYRSLFDYCVRRLGLSEGCAALRIHVSNVCREFPLLLDALGEGRISLTVAGKLAPRLTTRNCERLLSDCAGMTKREVEEYLVRLAPRPVVSPGIRRQPVAPGVATPVSAPPVSADALPDSASDPAPARPSTPTRRSSVEPCRPEVFNVRFSVGKEFMDKLERLAEVGGFGNMASNIARVLERAMDDCLEKRDPQQREQRREKREARKIKKAATRSSRTDSVSIAGGGPVSRSPRASERSRYISPALRDRLLNAAGHRCEYTSEAGVRCSERSRLAIDHVQPWGKGGSSEESNLRVLCAPHNLLHAENCYGARSVEQKITAARENTGRRSRSSVNSPPRPDDVPRAHGPDPEPHDFVCEARAEEYVRCYMGIRQIERDTRRTLARVRPVASSRVEGMS